MNRFKIETMLTIGNRLPGVLRVCWASKVHLDSLLFSSSLLSIIDELGYAYDFSDIFYSAEAAETEGKNAIKLLSL